VTAAAPGPAWDPRSTLRPVPGTDTLRDLGGTPTADGRRVAAGLLYRAEVLTRPGTSPFCAVWDRADPAAYGALGVRTVIDLRSQAEQERVASAWAPATGAAYVPIPIEDPAGTGADYVGQVLDGRRTSFTERDLADHYALILRLRAARFVAALDVIADPARLPVLVHCAAGKDRTGMLVALLLEALGVPRDLVLAEYAFTGVLRPDRVAVFAPVFAGSGVELSAISALFDAPAGAMAAALDGLDDEFGSVQGYLGGDGGLVEALRAALLDRPGDPGPRPADPATPPAHQGRPPPAPAGPVG
jgi:protein-tyrosine phosphatase